MMFIKEVGYGVFGPNLDTSRGLPKPTSIFSAEAAAIFSAVTESSFSWKAIITDSASVLKALESPKNRHPLVQAIRMASNSNTVYVWVPSHCNISGNEAADKLAAIGRSKTPVEPEVPAADLKIWIKTIIASAWDKEWANTRDPFLRKIKGDTKCWSDTKNWKDQRVLSRLRCGYTRFSHDLGSRDGFHKQCMGCSTKMSVEHLIINCPAHQNLRDQCGIGLSIRDALSNDPDRERSLLDFLKDTGYYQYT